jgi:hypothetical protein
MSLPIFLDRQLSRHGVRSLPVLLLYSKGKRIRYHGPRKLESIVYFFTKATGNLQMANSVIEKAMVFDIL